MFEVTARGGRREWRVEISDAKMGPGCENEVVVSAGAGQIPIRRCTGIDTADIDINEGPVKSWEVTRHTTQYPTFRRAVLPPSHVCPASGRCHAVTCSCAGGIVCGRQIKMLAGRGLLSVQRRDQRAVLESPCSGS
jgi:hypothetical protein